LITARLAPRGFCVPGNATEAVSFAPNQLIKPGAKLVTRADDVIAEDPQHIDDLVETSGLNSSEVLATLFEMEMKGLVDAAIAWEAVQQGIVVTHGQK
jgi:predicted Rossmann fold nucleotide-binding protein DprA/Smf involved in DNA uptake